MRKTRYFGCHVSAAGGLSQAILNGTELQVNTIQLHPTAPQRWHTKLFAPELESDAVKLRKESGIERLFFHGQYLINLATGNPSHAAMARASLVAYLDLIARMEGDGVIFHLGSAKDQPDDRTALRLCAEAINRILDESPNDGRLLLEVAAGSGSIIGDRMEELAEVYAQIDRQDRVGFALDTQHLWASGYNLTEELPYVLEQVKEHFTLEKVWAIHLNDSMTSLASRKDRHENLGDGLIGETALKAFIHLPEFAEIPFILETPGLKSMETANLEVEKLRAWLDARK